MLAINFLSMVWILLYNQACYNEASGYLKHSYKITFFVKGKILIYVEEWRKGKEEEKKGSRGLVY